MRGIKIVTFVKFQLKTDITLYAEILLGFHKDRKYDLPVFKYYTDIIVRGRLFPAYNSISSKHLMSVEILELSLSKTLDYPKRMPSPIFCSNCPPKENPSPRESSPYKAF